MKYDPGIRASGPRPRSGTAPPIGTNGLTDILNMGEKKAPTVSGWGLMKIDKVRSGEVETVKVHDLVPGRDEVVQELLL